MAQLTFTKQGDLYVALFEATADFNLRIERTTRGTMNVFQRTTASGEYAFTASLPNDVVADYDFVGAIYPKYIKVVSSAEVINAELTLKA